MASVVGPLVGLTVGPAVGPAVDPQAVSIVDSMRREATSRNICLSSNNLRSLWPFCTVRLAMLAESKAVSCKCVVSAWYAP